MPSPLSLVSIIIPVYNGEWSVGRAVKSALAQTYPRCEVIVVDDGSTDQTLEVLADYGELINVVRQSDNCGRSAARNIGLKHASGEFIVFLDADDTLLPHMVEQQIAYLQAHSGVAFVYGHAWMSDVCGEIIQPPVLMGAPLEPGRPPFVSLVMGQSLLIHTALIRRSVLPTLGAFDETLYVSEDWDLWLRLAAQYQVGFTSLPLATCSINPERSTQRLAAYNVQVHTPRVLANAFNYLPPDSALHALKPKAVGRALVQWGACLEYALNSPERMADYLRRALATCPELSNDLETVPRGVAQFATWYQRDGAEFICNFFQAMPPEFSTLKLLMRPTLAFYHSKQAQLVVTQRRYLLAVWHLVLAAWNDPVALGWALRRFTNRLCSLHT